MDKETLVARARQWSKSQMETGAGHHWAHIERVVKNGAALARREGADELVVQLAALMHDVINLPKDHPERSMASTKSADAAGKWLQGKLDERRIELVEEAIRCHSFSAEITPESLEAKVVSDADNLDALGAIGIARVFEVGGALGTQLMNGDDPFCHGRDPDDSTYTLDHFYTKLLRLEGRFYTDSGLRAARTRLDFMREYLTRLKEEVNPALPSASST